MVKIKSFRPKQFNKAALFSSGNSVSSGNRAGQPTMSPQPGGQIDEPVFPQSFAPTTPGQPGEIHNRKEPSDGKVLKLIPLGGVGVVQKNMFVYEYGNDIVIIDCGVSFPDDGMPGVDLVIPDISYLKDKKNKIRAIVVTHAHDDHIGALPYLWPELKVPIYSQKLTCGFIRTKFNEHKLPKEAINVLKIDDVLQLGAFKVSFFQVSHSVPDSTGIVLETPVGTLIHQADFKIDWTPVNGQVTNVAKAAHWGERGISLMAIDCLGVEKPGYTLSERTIQPTFEAIERETKGKLIITLMTSNITRIQQALNVAERTGRKVAISGRSMENNFQVSQELGYLDIPPNLMVRQEEMKSYPDGKLMLIVAGSLGQPGSALSRAANGDHKFIQIKKGDTVIFSADPMPSAVVAQGALIDKLTKIGATVYASSLTPDLHVSVLPDTEVLVRNRQGEIILDEIRNVDDDIEAYSFDRKNCTTSWKKAKKVQHRYKGLVYRITTKAGRSVEVTKGHSLFVLKNYQLEEIKSENLKIGDNLIIPKSLKIEDSQRTVDFIQYLSSQKNYHQVGNYLYYGSRCIGPSKLLLNNQLCRLFGYYLAEGSAPRHLSIVLHVNEIELTEEINGLVKKLLNCSLRTEIRLNSHSQEITFGTPFLGRIFKTWFGENAKTKRVPSFILNASEELKLSFLGAYINGDGSIDKGKKHSRIRVKTASQKLASDLLYLFSSVGIIAKFDHLGNTSERILNKRRFKAGYSYVIRIQGREYISKLLPYLSKKFQNYFYLYYENDHRASYNQTHAPEALPLREINILSEVKPRANTALATVYHQIKRGKVDLSQEYINRQIIRRDAEIIRNPLVYYLDGDLLFDPIKKIETRTYEGSVYDLSVLGSENFLGGFGGIFIHNSGHAAREEIKLMVNLIKPKYLMPMGGEFRHMKAFQKIAQEMGYREDQVLLPDEGGVINLTPSKAYLNGFVETNNVYVDGLGVGDVGSIVLRDRQVMSAEGVVVIVVPIDIHNGQVAGEPDVISRGFVFEKESADLIEAAREIVKSCLKDRQDKTLDWRYSRSEIERSLEKFFYEETKRSPLILPIVVEV